MQPKILLRISAVAITVFWLGHTVGGMLLGKSRGPAEDALLAALAAYHFDVMGSTRSHHDFYIGEGWYLSAALVSMIVMCWLLSNATLESPALAARISLVIALFFAASVALCAAFFFVAPLATSAVASLACAAAWWRLRSG
ncbi:MAG TPA: hypothetical protein VGP93_09525 [Polyangiaceae bacterium]|nr:hypothetical protein [Polyangiaceae bacterium]